MSAPAPNLLSAMLSVELGSPRCGKVRDTYQLGDSEMLLVVASDRISIFDFVLGAEVPNKGAVLTAMTVMWLEQVFRCIPNHLVECGRQIDGFLPRALRNNPELQSRAMVVRKLEMLPVEAIVRGYLTGSGWKDYQRTGHVCGHKLPELLHDGSKLHCPIFTPSTKAEEGHDENISAASVVQRFGAEVQDLPLGLFELANEHALSAGLVIADTKFEFGREPGSARLVLADEVLTPDSSRFWSLAEWGEADAKGKSPAGYDKQLVREWGKSVPTPFVVVFGGDREEVGINKLDPKDAQHREFVASVALPREVVEATTRRYEEVFHMIAGCSLGEYQELEMGIEL